MKTYSDKPRKRRARKDAAAAAGDGPEDRAEKTAAGSGDPVPADSNGATGQAAKPPARPDDPAPPGGDGNSGADGNGGAGVGGESAGAGGPPPDPFALIERHLGAVYSLLSQVPTGAGEPLRKLNWTVLPAVALRQFRIVRDKDGAPIAYVSWALFSQEVEDKITKLPLDDKLYQSIVPSDWKSGERPFIIDLYAKDPKVGQRLVTRIKQEIFPDTELRARGIRAGGKETEWLVVKPRQPGEAPPPAA